MQAYLDMLPRLEAEESMLATDRIAMGSGLGTKASRRRTMSAWTKAAAGPSEKSTGPNLAAARAVGIRVIVHGQ